MEVGAGAGRQVFRIDLKDYSNPMLLARKVQADEGDPGGAQWLVVPDYRASSVPLLATVCREFGLKVTTAGEIGAQVCQAGGVSWSVRQRLPKNEGAILAALALAAHYFPEPGEDGSPVASFAYASFLLGGHYDIWQAWRELSQPEKQRIAAVLAAAPEELARPGIFRDRAVKLLERDSDDQRPAQFRLPDCGPARAQSAIPMVGGDLLGTWTASWTGSARTTPGGGPTSLLARASGSRKPGTRPGTG